MDGCPPLWLRVGDEPLDGVAEEPTSGPGGQQRAAEGGVEFGEPGLEHLDGLLGEWCCPAFAPVSNTGRSW